MSQLSGHCEVISNRLRRHQQNVNRASETWDRCVKIVVLSPYTDSLCRVRNKIMNVLSWHTDYAHTRIHVVYFLICCATREINTRITLSWAHKQFATRIHTWFCFIGCFWTTKIVMTTKGALADHFLLCIKVVHLRVFFTIIEYLSSPTMNFVCIF